MENFELEDFQEATRVIREYIPRWFLQFKFVPKMDFLERNYENQRIFQTFCPQKYT